MSKILSLSFLMIILGGFVLGYSNQVGDKYCREDNLSNGEVCDNLFYKSNIVQVSGRARIFTGIPKVTDGDSLKLGKIRIRLFGIDAPESKQICHHRREEWRCGWEATNALANIVGKHWVSCIEKDIDRYERVIAVCKVGPIDLSAWMVVNGWALAYRRYSAEYVDEEEMARAKKKGLWRGHFMKPWEWRRSR